MAKFVAPHSFFSREVLTRVCNRSVFALAQNLRIRYVVKLNGNFGRDEQKTMSYQTGKKRGYPIKKLDTDKSASED